jgi:hypothetical protein
LIWLIHEIGLCLLWSRALAWCYIASFLATRP